MGSKHNPPRWWLQGDYEVETAASWQRLMSLTEKSRGPSEREKIDQDAWLYGKGFGWYNADGDLRHIPAKDVIVVSRDEVPPQHERQREPRVTGWTTWIEENGAPCLRPRTHEEIPVSVELQVGEEILVPMFFGWALVKVLSPAAAASEDYYAHLHRGPGVWRSNGGGNMRAIRKLNLEI